MAARKKRLAIQSRLLSEADTAAYLNRSLTWLADHREELDAAGFPQPLPVVGQRDKLAIDAWLDRLGSSDGTELMDFDNAWERACHG